MMFIGSDILFCVALGFRRFHMGDLFPRRILLIVFNTIVYDFSKKFNTYFAIYYYFLKNSTYSISKSLSYKGIDPLVFAFEIWYTLPSDVYFWKEGEYEYCKVRKRAKHSFSFYRQGIQFCFLSNTFCGNLHYIRT